MSAPSAPVLGSSCCDGSDASVLVEPRRARKSSGSGSDSGGRRKVCRHYLTKTCKYGVIGDGCNFSHPKKCRKYLTHGDKSSRGCTKGKKCDFFHPPLCWSSVKTGECTREKCKFQHVRGTKLVRGACPETLAKIPSTGSNTGQVLASGRGIEASGAKPQAREQRDSVRWPLSQMRGSIFQS